MGGFLGGAVAVLVLGVVLSLTTPMSRQPDGVDTPAQPSEALGVEHMLTKQENYRDPEVMA